MALLPNVLGKQAAKAAGAYEAWMVDESGRITEGTASNAWMVERDGTLVTRPAGPEILSGITRQTVLRLAKEAGMATAERPFTVAEAQNAAEAFATGTTILIKPVGRIDGKTVGDGSAGPVTRRLLDLYLAHMEKKR